MTHPTPLTSPQERTVITRTICIEVRYSDKMTEVIEVGEDDESMAEMAAMGWRRVAAAKAEPIGPMLAATLGDKVAFERAIEAEMGARTNPDDGRIDTTVHGEPVFGARPPGELGEIKLNGDGFIRFAGDTSHLVLQPGLDVLKFGAGEMNGHAVPQSQSLDGHPIPFSALVTNQTDEARNSVRVVGLGAPEAKGEHEPRVNGRSHNFPAESGIARDTESQRRNEHILPKPSSVGQRAQVTNISPVPLVVLDDCHATLYSLQPRVRGNFITRDYGGHNRWQLASMEPNAWKHVEAEKSTRDASDGGKLPSERVLELAKRRRGIPGERVLEDNLLKDMLQAIDERLGRG